MLDRDDASPELRVLLAAAGSAAGVASGYDDPSTSPDGIDWQRTERLARRHGLLPILHGYLEETPAHDPPTEVRDDITEEADETNRRNLHFAGTLHRIVDAFDEAGVRAVPTKGPIVAVLAYGDLGRRTFGDLDFLVVPEDLADAATALEDEGFTLERDLGPHDLADVDWSATVTFPHEIEFVSGDGVQVELRIAHGDTFGDADLAVRDLWTDRGTVSVAGRSCPALSPTDRLVVLANHGSKHAWRRVEWLSGLAGVAHRTDGDWEAARDRARQRDTLREFDLGALLVAEVFDAPVPEPVERAARADDRVVRASKTVLDRLANDPFHLPSRIETQRFRGKLRGDRRRRYLRSTTRPTTADYSAVPLPEPLWPLYRVIRPIRRGLEALRS